MNGTLKKIDRIRKEEDDRNNWLWEYRKKEEEDRKKANEEIRVYS